MIRPVHVRVCLAFVLVAVPLLAAAQPAAKIPKIGVLSGNAPTSDACLEAFRHGLRALGHVEGQSHVLEVRWTEGRIDTFPQLAADLARRQVNVILSGTALSNAAAKAATSTIPIVMASSAYPVEEGIIASLARPGGNITGLATITGELMAKRLQLLKEVVPSAVRIAVIRQPGHLQNLYVKDLEAAARQLGAQLHVFESQRGEDLPRAFQNAVRDGAHAIMSTQAPFFAVHQAEIAQLALKHRLPSLSGESRAVEAGALLSYGPVITDACEQSATFVDKILKGAKPADLPVEQPRKIRLAINLRTAKALGLTIPPTLLLRADRVFE